MRTSRLAVLGALLLVLTACSFSASVGSKSLKPEELEKRITARLDKLDVESSKVDCPKSLKAEVDATATCTTTAKGLKFAIKATATKVKGDTVSFELDESIASVSSGLLEQQVATKMSEQQLRTSDVSCPKELKAEDGATTDCTLLANELKYAGTVTAHDVTDDNVPFSIDVPPPAIVPTNTLETQIAKELAGQVGSGIDSVSCPDELEGTVGTSVDCEVTAENGKKIDVSVTIDEAHFLNVHFKIKQK